MLLQIQANKNDQWIKFFILCKRKLKLLIFLKFLRSNYIQLNLSLEINQIFLNDLLDFI